MMLVVYRESTNEIGTFDSTFDVLELSDGFLLAPFNWKLILPNWLADEGFVVIGEL